MEVLDQPYNDGSFNYKLSVNWMLLCRNSQHIELRKLPQSYPKMALILEQCINPKYEGLEFGGMLRLLLIEDLSIQMVHSQSIRMDFTKWWDIQHVVKSSLNTSEIEALKIYVAIILYKCVNLHTIIYNDGLMGVIPFKLDNS